MSKSNQIGPLREKLDVYLKEMLYLNAAFEIYFSMKFNKEWEEAYKISPAYFSIIRKSLLDAIIVGIVRLFEKRKRSDCNFNKFIEDLKIDFKENHNILENLNSFKHYINSKQELIGNMLVWRDKIIAHLDKDWFLDKSNLAVGAPLYIDEIKDLISKSFDFLNSLSYEVDHSSQYTKYINQDDYMSLLNVISKK